MNCTKRNPAFTLVELTVAIAIIVILLAIALPATNRMWQQRNESSVVEAMKGVLRRTKLEAARQRESGLLFFVQDGVQKVVRIIPAPPNTPPTSTDANGNGILCDDPLTSEYCGFDCEDNVAPAGCDLLGQNRVVANRFMIDKDDRTIGVKSLPKPYRVCPRSVVDDNDSDPSNAIPTTVPQGVPYWDDTELFNEDFRKTNVVQPQRHRNFFTVIFGQDGRPIFERPVVIKDFDPACPLPLTPPPTAPVSGNITGLLLGKGLTRYFPCPRFDPTLPATAWMPQTFGAAAAPPNNNFALNDLLVDDGGIVINLPSVDGLLVYNEDVFKDLPTNTERRRYLRESAQPYFFSRTGELLVVAR